MTDILICLWEDCSFLSDSEEVIYNHSVKAHGSKGLPRCLWRSSLHRPPCKATINSKSHFRDHIVTHFSLAVRPCLCELCDSRFRNRQELWRHKKICGSASVPLSPVSSKDDLPQSPPMDFMMNPLSTTQDVGVRSSMALVLLLTLEKKSSIPIPTNYMNIINESISKNGYANARISPLFMQKIYNYMILVHRADCHDSQSLVSWRRSGIQDMMTQSQPVYNQIVKSCTFELDAGINKLMVLSCQLRLKKIQPHSSFNPYRVLLMGLIRDIWVNICILCNEDIGQIVELSPSSPLYRSPEDCRCAILGLRVIIQYQVDGIPLSLRKNSLAMHIKFLEEKLAQIIGAKFELIDRDTINQLCCKGFVCDDFCGDGLATLSHLNYDAALADRRPASSTQFKIVKVSPDSAEMIFWFKMGRNCEDFVMSEEPVSLRDNIILVNAIDEQGRTL